MEFHCRLWSFCLFPVPTTVNITHRSLTQTAAKLPIPRTPANHQVVYTTLPAPPAQNPVRGAIMSSPSLRPVNPQTGGRDAFFHTHFCTTQLDTFYLMDVAFDFLFRVCCWVWVGVFLVVCFVGFFFFLQYLSKL